MAKVVATLEPDTAAKIMQVSTQVAASPPWTPPTTDFAKSTRRTEMPPDSIRLPARMKNGIAASGNLLIAPNISLTIASRLRFACHAPTRLASPIDTATEMLSAKHSTIVRNIVDGIEDPDSVLRSVGRTRCYCAVSSSCRRGSSRQPTIPRTQKRPPIGSAR